jgi:predicted GNAT superfamily acetyltransferase
MIEIRPLTAHAELREAVELQRRIWGFEDIELLPLRMFVVAAKIGGQVLGAFDGTRMAGFSVAIPGLKPDATTYLHSHMLGVLPEYRNAGVGRSLKLRQRDDALERGISLIEWTFDPLEIKNAYFNIERLGAIVRRYVVNQYGTTTSKLHGGLPTDRCVAEWWIDRPQRSSKDSLVEGRIAIPSDIDATRVKDPARAREIQVKASEEFRAAFDRELAVIGFERSEEAGTYLLGQWESN